MEEAGTLRRPIIPAGAEHNAHIYYVLIPSSARRDHTLMRLAELGVDARSHYVPLHAAAAERRFGRTAGSLAKTEDLASRLIRLPLYTDITPDDQSRVLDALTSIRMLAP